ncbi:43kDa postsynaptic protein [Trema orientale]|uniref:43kDa postsynaptic protein n=1 Tax=Trema orientale TaxID=63057 RepID=A0A2P5EDR5_TREOI|nr:43kDa postsynaptic protein [Trema orientale]
MSQGVNIDHHHDDHDRPSPLLVAVPVLFIAESIKKQLPAMSYSSFVEKSSTRALSSSSSSSSGSADGVNCIVCMNGIDGRQEVRVPFNCRHVFHRECLDAWVDQGQATCPLCRSKLLPSTSQNHDDHQNEFGSEGDPWRKERMVYLFGDDYLFWRP